MMWLLREEINIVRPELKYKKKKKNIFFQFFPCPSRIQIWPSFWRWCQGSNESLIKGKHNYNWTISHAKKGYIFIKGFLKGVADRKRKVVKDTKETKREKFEITAAFLFWSQRNSSRIRIFYLYPHIFNLPILYSWHYKQVNNLHGEEADRDYLS